MLDSQQQFCRKQASPSCRNQQRPLDKVGQSDVAHSLKQIMFVEREIEAQKIELALRPDFNLVDAFRLFDVKAMGGCSF